MIDIKHEGRWLHRLDPEQSNPREAAFAEQWKDEQENHVLMALVCTRPAEGGEHAFFGMMQDCELTQRDAEVAATVIQWLGSNVGWCFLEMALGRIGLRIVDGKGREA